jgi:hypothetical protein
MINCLGDSQTQMSPYYSVPPEMMWVEQTAALLRTAGYDAQARSYGIGGQSTGQMLNRVDVLSMWEIPRIAILYGGVNDVETGNVPVASAATAGSIVVSSNAQWYGVGMVIAFTDGSIFAPALTAVQLAVGSTGSIALAASSANSTITSVGVYVTPTGYASSALATANNRALLLQTTLTPTSSGSLTTLSNSGAPMPTAGTQAMCQAFVKAMKYGVVGAGVGSATLNWVKGQADLPANGYSRQRAVVLDDTSATGGIGPIATRQSALVPGDSSAVPQQSVWECRTPQAGELGWGRVAVTGMGPFTDCCSRIILLSTNYLNWTSGGDNAGASTFYAPNVAIRSLVQAAATAESVVYGDLFGFQTALITSGETTQGSNSWHAIANNQHHNAYGHNTVARCVISTILAQSGWL